jgi:tocopherol cyclase
MLYPFKKLYRPEFFQGNRRLERPSRYFEGWYFKVVFDGEPFALIPGVSLTAEDAHGFIQVIGGSAGSSRYHRFELEEFSYNRKDFEIRLGDNRFSLEGIEVDLDDLRARLTIGEWVRWPSSLLSPGSMGWYSFMRFMECYHGVIVLDADINGTVNGKSRSGGRFYLEKDWGISFPKAWIWMQTNSFSSRASLTCSVARVPFAGREFTGFIIGLFAEGKLYSFTTYNGSRVSEIEYDEGSVGITARKGGMVLEIRARREAGAQLASPIQGEMTGRIEETLGSAITVDLSQDGRRLFADRGGHAGLEVINPELLRAEILDPGTR